MLFDDLSAGRELLRGEALLDYLKHERPDLVRAFLSKLAGAVAYLHHMGLYHGDLTPENVSIYVLERR